MGDVYDNGRGILWILTIVMSFAFFTGCDSAEKQFHTGFGYEIGRKSDGTTIAKNMTNAVELYMKAAERGYPDAQFLLGVYHLQGQDVIKDPEKGCSLLRSSAEKGHAHAVKLYNLVCAGRKEPADLYGWIHTDFSNIWFSWYGSTCDWYFSKYQH